MSFDIELTWQGFEISYLTARLIQAIQYALSKLSLVNLNKRREPGYSVNQITYWLTLQTGDYGVIIDLHVDSMSLTSFNKCNVVFF